MRGFAPYFATLTGKPDGFYIHNWTSPQGLHLALDWFAFGWCLLLSVLLVLGTRESAQFNNVVTVLHVLLVAFIIVAGEHETPAATSAVAILGRAPQPPNSARRDRF